MTDADRRAARPERGRGAAGRDSGGERPARLERRMGVLPATATNIIAMVGVGPFLVIPFMLASMNGPHIIYAWIAGAVLAMCDGLVYAQLGAALPGSGGPYVYLREAYEPFGLGRLMSFVYICQVILVAPLSIATGAVGFSDYLQFYWAGMTPIQHHLIAAAVCVAMTALLYRDIAAVGRLAVIMMGVVLATVGWVIVAGLFKVSAHDAFGFPPEAYRLDRALLGQVGATSVLAMYSYGGYNQVCSIGEEIEAPETTIPRSIVLSIVAVALIYIVMSSVIVGMVPWREAVHTRTIASLFIARTFADPAQGRLAAVVMTALILFVAAASLYSIILGYSRVPFAAARDGNFFRVFARVHPTKHFPHVALLTIGAVALPFCFFSLGDLVNWLMQVQIATIFVWQCAAVILLRRYRRDLAQPFTMWLYPVPALVALALWIYVYATGPTAGMAFSAGFLAVSVAAYFVFRRVHEDT
jgi:amino acid transporter